MANNKQLTYNIQFKASQSDLENIKKQLRDIQNITTSQYQKANPNASKDLAEASRELVSIKKEAQEISNIFNKSFNINLKATNINQLKNELSKLDIDKLYVSFSKLGAAGTSAFRGITAAALSGNIQLKQTNKILDDIATSFKNTVKWGISSSVWNTLTNSIQKAWTYTKNLDQSLNDIRIVSGQTADQMERMAIQANKTAESLGATTLDYTKAALIYYQQGLDDTAVQERTEVTLRMANALGSSANEVSDYMTAIWNNFDNGSQSLEYYADVITALGAATASSSEEIADGLGKFAAVADTVGLSYEYATSALATVVAETRQSADTVGTAFKTLFARIQDLELGNTLDDGTTLGQYSEALEKVGINIKDQQGNLKDMNDILDEMGAKWGNLTKDQQVALAQNVAGIRQYTQLVALMDNWDTFNENLNTATHSTGTLKKQQDIYMESTEAHLNKLSASTERLMKALVNKDDVNGLLDSFSGLINFVANFTESIGGGRTALLALGSIAVQVFDTQIARGLSNTIANFKTVNASIKQSQKDLETFQRIQNSQAGRQDAGIQAELEVTKKIAPYRQYMTEAQIEETNGLIRQAGELETLKAQWKEIKEEAFGYVELLNVDHPDFESGDLNLDTYTDEDAVNDIEQLNRLRSLMSELRGEIDSLGDDVYSMSKKSQETLTENWKTYAENFKQDSRGILDLIQEISDESGQLFDAKTLDKIKKRAQDNIKKTKWFGKNDVTLDIQITKNTKDQMQELKDDFTNLAKDFEKKQGSILNYFAKEFGETSWTVELENKTKELHQNVDLIAESLAKVNEIHGFTNLVGGIGQVSAGISTLINLTNIWKNDSLSTGEKVLQIFTNLATGLPLIINGYKTVIDSGAQVLSILKAQTFASLQKQAVDGKEALSTLAKIQFKKMEAKSEEEMIALRQTAIAGQNATILLNGAESASNLSLATTFGVLAGAVWTALAPLLPFVAAIGAVVGAIALLVKAYNSDKDAAKEAAEYAEQAADAAEEATQRYEEMVSAFDKYDSAIEKLEELKVGTEEYRDAVEEANKAVMDLIRSDNSLAKHVVRGDNGVLKFDDEGQILANAKSRMNSANAAANISQINANNKQLTSDRTDFLREAGIDLEVNLAKSSMATLSYTLQRSLSNEQLEGVINSLLDKTEGFIRSDLEALGTLTDEQIDVLMNNQDSLEKLIKSTDDLNATNKLLVDESLRNSLEKKDDFAKQGDAAKNAITSLYGEGATEEIQKKLEKEAKDKWDHDFAFGWGNEDEVHKAYAEAMGWEVTKDHWGDTADYVDVKTGEEHKKVSDDAARAYLKAQYVAEHLADYDEDSYKKISTAVQKITDSDLNEKYGNGFEEAILNSIANKKGEISLESIYGVLDPNELLDFEDANGSWWKEKLGLTDEQFKTLGYGSADGFAKAFAEGLTNYQWSADKALDLALNGREDQLEGYDLKTDEVKNYSKYVMDIAEADDTLADSLKYNAEAATIVTQSIMRMNNGIDKLADGLEDWEDVLKNSEKSSEEYYEALSNLQDAMGDLLDIEDEYVTDSFIQDHLQDIEKAAEGDAEAIDRLHKELAKDIVLNVALNNQIDFDDIDIDSLTDKINNLEIPDIEVGSSMDFSKMDTDMQEFTKKMMEIVSEAHMTADEANAFFGQMGFQAKFDTKKEKITRSVPVETTESEITSIFPLKMTSRTYQSGTESVTQEVDVPAMTTDGSEPQITLTKKATGSYNNYSSNNKGGGSPGKSGGDNKPDKMDKVSVDPDRYHKVNTQITKVDNALSKLQSQQDKFVGSKLINNLNNQWTLLNTQIENYNEKLRIANEEQAELASELTGKGVIFNADGTISNYTEVIKTQEDYVNSLINNYNSMSKEQQESYKATVEQAQEDFDKLQTDLDRYDELVSDFIPGLQQEIQDAMDEQIEINIQKFNMEIEITLDMTQATRDWNEWKKRAIDGINPEDIYGNANARLQDFYTYFNEAATAEAQVGTRHLNDTLEELYRMDRGENNIYGDNRAQALEDLRTYYTQLMQSITDVIELQDELHQSLLDEIDEVQEKFDEQIASYEFLRDLINHDIKVIQLTLGEDAYGEMAKFYEAQQNNYEKQLDFQRQQKDFWYAQMQAAEEGTEEWESARDKWKDAVSEFNSILEEGLQNAVDKFQNAINNIFKNLNNTITSGMGLDYVNTQWDLINQNADRYLDTINATYGIRELEKKYIDSINDTDNISAQQRLKKLMDGQLENLKQRDRLTQYDLDRANKLYEIELARIALEEAQRNKSQMRLRRDSQGNYTYQYVADDDAIKDAESQLSSLYNDLYNFDRDRYNQVLNDIYSIWDSYQQAMAEAALINDPELRAEKERLIQEQYNELMMQAEEDYQIAKYDLQESFFWDWVDLNNMTLDQFKALTDNEKDIIMTDMVPTWKNGISEMIDAMIAEGGFASVTQQAWLDIKEAENQYAEDMTELETISGQTFETIINGEDDSIGKAKDLIKTNDELIDAYGKELAAVQSVYDKVRALRQEYEAAEKAAIAAAKAAYEYEQKELLKQQEDAKNQNQTTSSAGISGNNSTNNSNENNINANGANSGSNGGNGSPEVGETVTYVGGKYYASSYGDGPTGSRGPGKKVKITAIANGRPYPIHVMSNDSAYGWLRQDQLSGYDTGGYTGDWNNGGRLALLHQKELVLNAEDTKNMLNTVAIMRSLAYSLGSNMLARLAGASAVGYNGTNGGAEALEQNVHIDAQFPNVRNAAEIEEALNNLVNAASQRIYER